MKEHRNLLRRRAAKAAMVFLFALALYFFSRSPALDEMDSVQFAMGVRSFDLWHHQPHPPGYPLFIFLGWLGEKLFGAGPDLALHFVSAIGGALFIAIWFLIISEQFSERLAWWVATCLMVTLVVWITATQVMTDALAAGLLSAELLAAIYYASRKRTSWLIGAALLGAAAAGTRPQLILIVGLILGWALKKNAAKMWWIGFGALIGGCLLWLLPMWFLQARLRPDIPIWRVYFDLVYSQWRWRLDKPQTYIGAGDWTPRYLGLRFVGHILGWFARGFGFEAAPWTLAAGIVLTVVGSTAYVLRCRTDEDRDFWRCHRAWALTYIFIIFCFLPGHQRYYVPIFPLLLVVLLRGLLSLPRPWNIGSILFPALLLYIAIPLALENHREAAPPLRVIRYLEKLYPPTERRDVVLIFGSARRFTEWYTPEFLIMQQTPNSPVTSEILERASAAYADDENVRLPPGWKLSLITSFRRSVLIHYKHRFVPLFRIERTSQP